MTERDLEKLVVELTKDFTEIHKKIDALVEARLPDKFTEIHKKIDNLIEYRLPEIITTLQGDLKNPVGLMHTVRDLNEDINNPKHGLLARLDKLEESEEARQKTDWIQKGWLSGAMLVLIIIWEIVKTVL